MWKQYTARSGEQLAKQKLSLKIELTGNLGSRKHGSMATFEPGQQSKVNSQLIIGACFCQLVSCWQTRLSDTADYSQLTCEILAQPRLNKLGPETAQYSNKMNE